MFTRQVRDVVRDVHWFISRYMYIGSIYVYIRSICVWLRVVVRVCSLVVRFGGDYYYYEYKSVQ